MTLQPRVLHIVADGRPGGGTTAVLGLCEDMVAKGALQVTLISQAGSYALAAARKLGVRTAEIDFFRGRLDLSIGPKLRRSIDEIRPSLIHVHGSRAALPLALVSCLWRLPPIVYTVHGFHFVGKAPFGRYLGALAERFIAWRADTVVYVSHGDKKIAAEWGLLPKLDGRTLVIHNGIDPADLGGASAAADKRHDIAFVGRLVRQKNPLFMIDIMRQLVDQGISLVMVGGGELEERVRHYATESGVADRITFLGAVDRAGAISAIRSAKLYVFPSLWEGLPITPMEASSLGIPVVASRVSGTDEVVLDGHNGYTVKGFDAQAYADVIARLLGDAGLREQMGRNGIALVRQRFLRGECASHYLDAYTHVLADASP